MNAPRYVSQIQFAHLMGVSRSWVTKLKQDGRLVMTPDGKVDVEASRARMNATGGDRPDVAARHASEKGRAVIGDDKPAKAGAHLGSYQAARAEKEKYAALMAEAEYEQKIGNLIPREDVEAAMRFVGGYIRAQLDVLPDQTAPLVAPVASLEEAHEILTQSCRDALASIGEAIARQCAALEQGAAA